MLEKLFKVKDNATVNLFGKELIPKWDSLYCNVKIQAKNQRNFYFIFRFQTYVEICCLFFSNIRKIM